MKTLENMKKARDNKAKQKAILEQFKKHEAEMEAKKEEMKKEVDFLRPIVKDKFWPIVADKKIEEASIICQIFTGRMEEYFQKLRAKMKVSELGLQDLFVEGDEYKVYEAVKDLTLEQANKVVGGFDEAISACVRREQKSRPITDLEDLASEFV
jgi:hypothetical protein